jgi:signal transduction histidine kinase
MGARGSGTLARQRVVSDPFLFAVSISARMGGLRPGLFATVLGAIVGLFLSFEPAESLAIFNSVSLVHLGMYGGSGWVVSHLFESLIKSRNQLEIQTAQHEYLLHQSSTIMWTVDHELRYTTEPSGQGMATVPSEFRVKIGQSIYELLKTRDDTNAAIAAHRRALKGEMVEYEIEWFGRYYTGIVSPFRKRSKIVGVFGMAFDITARRNQKEALKLAKEQAEAANLAKGAFLANMSHEIRTPVTAMIGFSELLANPDITSEQRSKFADLVVSNGRHLVHLIDDLLDLSRAESVKSKVEIREISLPKLMADVNNMFSTQAEKKGISLQHSISPTVHEFIHTDSHRLRQILFNVIGNAIKFTEQGGVNVDISSTGIPDRRGQHQIKFTVSDTGIGIPSERQGELFQPFSQVDPSYSRKYGGAGLGLALSRQLANSLGGNVELTKSAPGEGSTFVITIDSNIAKSDVAVR